MRRCSHLCNPRRHSSHAPSAEMVFNKELGSALTVEPPCSWRLLPKLRRLVPIAGSRSPPEPSSVQNAGKKCSSHASIDSASSPTVLATLRPSVSRQEYKNRAGRIERFLTRIPEQS